MVGLISLKPLFNDAGTLHHIFELGEREVGELQEVFDSHK